MTEEKKQEVESIVPKRGKWEDSAKSPSLLSHGKSRLGLTCPSTKGKLVNDLRSLYQKLIDNVTMNDNGCWLWTGPHNKGGYGRMQVGKRLQLVTHVSLWLHGRRLPDGLVVSHRCDRPACVNPDHLVLCNQKYNMADAALKGRTATGEKHGMVKASLEQRDLIRVRLLKGDAVRLLAREFSMSPKTVRKMKREIYHG